MEVVELAHPGDLDPWAVTIDDLARRAGETGFASSAWLRAWWEVLEPRCSVTLLVDDGPRGVEGLWALARLRRRVHRRVPIALGYCGTAGSGSGAADHMGPLATSGASCLRLVAAVAGRSSQTYLLESIAERHRAQLDQHLARSVIAETPCPHIDLRGVDAAGDLWRPSRRGDLRRCMRRCEERGLERTWTRLDGSNVDLLDDLRALHELLWRSRGRAGVLDTTRITFLGEVARRMDQPDGMWLQRIGDAEHAVAAQLVLRFGSTLCSYATGRDPALANLGLGVLLEAGGIELAVDEGMDSYDFLRGTEPHKLALGGVPRVDATYCVPRGVGGRLLEVRERLSSGRLAWT